MLIEQLSRRPHVYNALHAAHVVRGRSEMSVLERQALARYAAGRASALEIGTQHGVSACVIAAALAPRGTLTCVDPWVGANNPCLSIAQREFQRHGVRDRIRIVRGFSKDIEHELARYDFMFIDGDHSEEGLAGDWGLVHRHLSPDGVVCLHDTIGRDLGSTRYYNRVIARDAAFTLIDAVDSLSVLTHSPRQG